MVYNVRKLTKEGEIMHEKKYVMHEVRMITNLIKRNINPVDKKLTGMQGFILGYINRNAHEVFQRDIEQKFNIRRSTATGILNNLEKNGYIVRKTSPNDARLKTLIPTEKAKLCQNHVEKDIERIEKLITHDISKEELASFFKVTDKIKHNLERNDAQ